MSDYTEKNSNLIPKIDIPCFAWNSQAEQGLLFFKAKSLNINISFLYLLCYCSLVPRSSNGFCRCFAFQIGKICCHHCIIRHFQFRKCLPVNSNSFISISRRSPKRQIRFGTAIRKLNKSEMPHTTSRVITAPK